MKNKIEYIVIAGSSGGHILPAIKFINNLSKVKNPNNILFITNKIGKNFINKISSKEIKKIQIGSSNKISYINIVMFWLNSIRNNLQNSWKYSQAR